MPWIEHRGRGWAVRTRDDAGHQRWLTGVLHARDDAQAWLESRGWSSQRSVPLSALIDRWAAAQAHSPYAMDAVSRLAMVCRDQAWIHVGDISLRALESWNVAKGGRGRSQPGRGVDRAWQYLRTILRWARQVHGIPVDEMVLAASPPRRQRKAPRVLLTEAQLGAILQRGQRYGPAAAGLLVYLSTYGARPITACRLRRRDCDPDARMLTIPHAKRSGGWRHPITPEHAALWVSCASSDLDGPLFPHWHESRAWRISRGRADEMVSWYRRGIAQPLIKRQELPEWHSMYDLKRRAISRALALGLDAATVALFTGHLDIGQVLCYAKTNESTAVSALAKLCPHSCPHAPTSD